ncbi:unnamed protein product [Symbiodinium sp. CCMP2456]|nr:unnamed protein product [Symbiodinium sp. CCMP2456]
MAGSFVGESLTVDVLNVMGIRPPPGLSAQTTGASTEPWSTSDEGHECFLCRCCHNGRVKPDKKQRATVKSMSAWACLAWGSSFRHACRMAVPAAEVKHSFSTCSWRNSPCVLKKQVVSTPSSRSCRRSTVVWQSHRQASPIYPVHRCATWRR